MGRSAKMDELLSILRLNLNISMYYTYLLICQKMGGGVGGGAAGKGVVRGRQRVCCLIVLGFNDTSTFVDRQRKPREGFECVGVQSNPYLTQNLNFM